MNNIVALIPARAGSKGIKRKNVKKLGNKRLIDISIDFALNSPLITNIIISTDIKEIVEESYSDIFEIITRTSELANDKAGMNEVVLDALKRSNMCKKEDLVVLLQPTSPFRKQHQLNEIVKLFASSKFDRVISFKEARENPNWLFIPTNNEAVKFSETKVKVRRQNFDRFLFPNGAFYLFTQKSFLKNPSVYHGKIGYYIMDEFTSWDLDTEWDWKIAKLLINQ